MSFLSVYPLVRKFKAIIVQSALITATLQTQITLKGVQLRGGTLGTGTPQKESVSGCDPATRTIEAFGALDHPSSAVEVPAAIRAQLPEGATVRKIMNTKLAPAGEQVVLFDASRDDLEPLPRVAVVVGRTPMRTLDSFSGYGFTHYLSACEFSLSPVRTAVAVAYSTAGDGSGTYFAILGWDSGDYRKLFEVEISQGRMVLQPGQLSVWESLGTGECVWCPSLYRVTRYRWTGTQFVNTETRKLPNPLDPGEVSETPLVISNNSQAE